MPVLTKHSKERIVERTDGVNFIREAKQCAKLAWSKGKTISQFQDYPRFQEYLNKKVKQSNTCSVRVYKGCVYVWKGKHKALVTAVPIPDIFKEEGITCLE